MNTLRGYVAGENTGGDVIVRWDVEPLDRSRRRLDERLVLAAPWLLRLLWSLYVRARPGSLLRRALLGHVIRVGLAANNRGDYKLLSAALSPAVEVHIFPDAPDARPVGTEPVYRGREGYLRASEIWKADFDGLRYEIREFVDPGGDRIGARVDRVGRGRLSGLEIRGTDFYVLQFEHGPHRRLWILHSEAAMLARLKGVQDLVSRATAPDQPA